MQQLEMAKAVTNTIEQRSVLIAEAGTGTGKTFAYLVPSLLKGGKTILSTGTKTLQDQLYLRDIPMLRSILHCPVSVAMLKGRGNYLCLHHLEQHRLNGTGEESEYVSQLNWIARRAKTVKGGEKTEFTEIAENAAVWAEITSTRENCLGQKCNFYDECFVVKARRSAQTADVIVVNHHLFFADMLLRDEGIAELLPASDTIVFDEAHLIPEIASLFFGDSATTGQLLELARDSQFEAARRVADFPGLELQARLVGKMTRDMRLVLAANLGRFPRHIAHADSAFSVALKNLLDALTGLENLLENQATRSEEIRNCWQRCQSLLHKFRRWQLAEEPDYVHWLEVLPQALYFHTTPLAIDELFQTQFADRSRALIFTSATLSIDGDFTHYCNTLGLTSGHAKSWGNVFDYPSQALLYLPAEMPDPNEGNFTQAVVDAALPVLRASRGRAFMLFTSIRAMNEAYHALKDRMPGHLSGPSILLQGESTKTELLNRFINNPGCILLGSYSFWEGIDVRGPILSLVIIDRLPFASPDDPVLSARIEKINHLGGNAFMECQLPEAIITLRQGMGRLIRDENDRGVLMICDPRILKKSYGRLILNSLPPMKRTTSLQEVETFFQE